MFAILLSKSMDPFYQNISSFPTVIYTVLLVVCLLYWLVAILGLIDLDFLHLDHLGHADSLDDTTSVDTLGGLMLRFGLYGVPLIVTISFVSLFGWFFCYLIVHYLFGIVPDGLWRYVAGGPVFVLTFYVSILISAQLIKPLRPLFKKAEQDTVKQILGQVAIVRTSRVDNNFGEAMLEDGGAGLILKVRTIGDEVFQKGDSVVLLEYLDEKNIYRVISEEDFNDNN